MSDLEIEIRKVLTQAIKEAIDKMTTKQLRALLREPLKDFIHKT